MSELADLTSRLREFARVRDWERFHTPKNLAMALTGEVGELVAELQWLTEAEAANVMDDPGAAARLRSEAADVFLYFLRLADVLGIDLAAAAHAKIDENEVRFAADIIDPHRI